MRTGREAGRQGSFSEMSEGKESVNEKREGGREGGREESVSEEKEGGVIYI